MSERASVGLAVLFSVPFIGAAVLLIGLVVFAAVTGEPVFVLDGEH